MAEQTSLVSELPGSLQPLGRQLLAWEHPTLHCFSSCPLLDPILLTLSRIYSLFQILLF